MEKAAETVLVPPRFLHHRFSVRPHVIFLLLIALALLIRVAIAMFFPSMYYPDEIFQTQEPAHRLAYGTGIVTWEWQEGIRSWVFPAFLACIMRATDWLGKGSSGYLFGIALTLSLLSLTSVWFGFAWAKRASGTAAALIAAALAAFWFELIYFGSKAFTEVIATHVLLPALYLGIYGDARNERRNIFIAGVLCGVAASLRIQLTPVVIFAAVWFCKARWKQRAGALVAGIILPILLFGLVDAITWSYPFQSFVRYFWVNAVKGVSRAFGIEPWYWYGPQIVRAFGPILLLALIGVRKSPFLGWLALINIVSHSLLSHKEIRFVYLVMPLTTTLAGLGSVEVASYLKDTFRLSYRSWLTVITSLLLLSALFAGIQFKGWTKDVDVIRTFNDLSHDSDICGLGVYNLPWFYTGGYTHLHQNVPMIMARPEPDFVKNIAEFNVLVSSGILPDSRNSFKLEGCRGGICVYRRNGLCSPPNNQEINRMLRKNEP